MDWVFCNKCFVLRSKVPIFITSCCHLLCKKCLKKICPICNKRTKSVEINNRMPSSIASYFDDIPKAISKLQKMIKFQFEHQALYAAEKSHLFDDIRKMKKIKDKVASSNKNYEEQIKQEISKIKKLQAYVAQCKKSRGKENTWFQTPLRPSRRPDSQPHSFGFSSQIDMNSWPSSSAAPRQNLETPTFFARSSSGQTNYSAGDGRSIILRNNFLPENRVENTFFTRDDTGYQTPMTTNTMSRRHPTLESLRLENLM